MKSAYIGLGSNLQNPVLQVKKAIKALSELPKSQLAAVSALYRSKPMGVLDQPDFINAVVCLKTALSPQALLQALHEIEATQHRVRRERWGARTIDCDILLYDNDKIHEPGLTIPHPEMLNRAFVVIPLLEINPECILPEGGKLADYQDHFDKEGLLRIQTQDKEHVN